MLTAAVEHHRTQAALSTRAKLEARRAWRRGSNGLISLVHLQQEAANESLAAVPRMLAEQGIDDAPVAEIRPQMFSGLSSNGSPLASLLVQARTEDALARMFVTQTADAARAASSVATAIRPTIQGHIRVLSGSSCARCAILAGRFYRWSTGFPRHPRCDCQMVPTDLAIAPDLITDPMQLFREGKIRTSRLDEKTGKRVFESGLSKADTEAVKAGADLSQVVNVRSKKAGLTTPGGGRILVRGGRPTPEGIFRLASDREQAIDLLERFGYIRGSAPARVAAVGRTEVVATPARPARDDIALTNPRLNEAEGFQNNCAYCVATYEMRRRGLSVTARPVAREIAEAGGVKTSDFLDMWRKADGSKVDPILTADRMGLVRQTASWSDGARGFVFVEWNWGVGHVLSVEKVGSELRFVDPQNAAAYTVQQLFADAKSRSIHVLRSDDLTATSATNAAMEAS